MGPIRARDLPPYAPDMNPIERLWLIIKANRFTDFVAKTREQLMERLDKARCWAKKRKTLNPKTCATRP
ncbi:MAG: superfamily endonuclease [Candidatus Sumerlaeota bacterium]|nr:superfamily endonuclease [Candidatus Sumerlaeota bacterium]